jgi:membrane fusion protein (multidrug efflux system)
MIPTIALVPELEGQKVYLYKKGKVVPQSVQAGIRTDQKVQILEGVSFGDTLLTTGLLQVRPGMQVQLQTVE